MGMTDQVSSTGHVQLVSDSMSVGNWRAHRDAKGTTVVGPPWEAMPAEVAVFLGAGTATPAYGSTRVPLPETEGGS